YKALLFMCMGAVIYSTGRHNLTELGGLAKKMPITMITCMIAAFSISGVPGFNGYVSKGMIVHAVELEGMHLLTIVLMLGSVGTFLSFLKLTYFTFFKKNDAIQAKEAPWPMLIAMSVVAFLCVAIGVYPKMLYAILPYPAVAAHYHAYGLAHTIGTLELLMMTAVGFVVLLAVFSPHERITYDIDTLYRKAGRGFMWLCEQPLVTVTDGMDKGLRKVADYIVWFSRNPATASKILAAKAMVAMAGSSVMRTLNPGYIQYEQDLAKLKQMHVDEPVQRVAIGTGVLLVLLLFTLYLVIYLTHGVVWI
ncbi:MAG: hypothetical protein KAT65_05690, partial [Methanophagales archaeon]|nr:hypothetical protein [Methanophagales archaeon]